MKFAGRARTMTKVTKRKLTIAGTVSILALTFAAGSAMAEEQQFDIEAQSLAKALLAFNEQSGLTVAAPRDLVESKTAPAVRGEMEPEEALEKILAGSGLQSTELANGAFTITLASTEPVESGTRPFRVAENAQGDSLRVVEEPAGATSATRTLETVVVSAQKKDENLQDVPISISAVTEQSIRQFGVAGDDVRLLSARVANLNVESTFGRTYPRFYIRGLGNSDFALNAQSSVELYFDEVVLGNPILKGQPIFDVERVEVLRGPQGTLFGRNAVAGAVHIITKKPSETPEGRASFSYGNFGTINAEAAIGGPLIDDVLSGRISVLYQSREDYVENLVTGNDVGAYTDVAFRGQLLFTPNEKLEALLQANTRSFGGVAALFHSTADDPVFGRQGFDRENILLGNDNVPDQDIDTVGVTLNTTYGFDSGMTLTSISSYTSGKSFTVGDIDATAAEALVNVDQIDNISQWTQEFRLASAQDQQLRWQGGLYYFRENLDYANSTANNAFQIGDPPGPFDLGRPGDPVFGAVHFVNHDLTSWAVFGQAEYDLNEDWTILGGVRFNNDETDARRTTGQFTPNPDNLQAIPNFNTPFYADGDRGLISLFGAPLTQETNLNSEEVTWDLSVTYNPSDQVTWYGRIAQGYQGGVIEAGGPFSSFAGADPQTALSYEVGLKAEPIRNKMRTNVALFYYDFSDQQLQGFIDTGNGGFTASLLNANGGTGTGIEAELEYYVTDNLFVSGNIGLTDTEIEGPTFFSALDGTIVDLDGRRFPFAPEITSAFLVEFNQPVAFGDGAELYANTDWTYRGDIDARFTAIEDPQFALDSYWEGAARIGLRNDRFDASVWARNITDEVGSTSVLSVIGFESEVFNSPRTYGIALSMNF